MRPLRRLLLRAPLLATLPAMAQRVRAQGARVDARTWCAGPPAQWPAREAVSLLADAASHGLAPDEYGATGLQRLVEQLATNPAAPAAGPLGDALTRAMLRYLADLHHGRVDPRRLHLDFAAPREDHFDAEALLLQALAAGRVAAAVDAAAPRLPQYRALREALAGLRSLVGHPAWDQALPPLPGAGRSRGKLEPGAAWSGLALLARRLHAWGDLDSPPPTPTAYDDGLVEAVRAFQRRHGLAIDGVVGTQTLAALQVGPAQRARQVELALERLRWTPVTQSPRMVTINVPEFVLRTYEVENGRVRLRGSMAVIVGRAAATRTPLFDEEMRYVEFNPYWNVPRSIARNELVPRLRRDPAYFERQGFEFVGPAGVSGELTPEALERVLAGRWRIRQRPGAANALGRIKFVFPNRSAVYLHDTPAGELFARARRDFSHGCIRVEDPLALARFVLQPQPEWTDEAIRRATTPGPSATVALAHPVTVLIAYSTVVVKDGRTHFLHDLYGHDRTLDEALQARGRRQAGTIPRP